MQTAASDVIFVLSVYINHYTVPSFVSCTVAHNISRSGLVLICSTLLKFLFYAFFPFFAIFTVQLHSNTGVFNLQSKTQQTCEFTKMKNWKINSILSYNINYSKTKLKRQQFTNTHLNCSVRTHGKIKL